MENTFSSLNDAIVTLSLKKEGMFISAFPGQIIFGKVKNQVYEAKERFVIRRSQFKEFYLSIVCILSSITSNNTSKGQLFSDVQCYYFWEVLADKTIKIINEKNNVSFFSIGFNHEEFLNLLTYFHRLILVCLLLKNQEIDILEKLYCMNTNEIILVAQQKSQMVKFCKENDISDQFVKPFEILIKSYLDILLVLAKLNKLIEKDCEIDSILK